MEWSAKEHRNESSSEAVVATRGCLAIIGCRLDRCVPGAAVRMMETNVDGKSLYLIVRLPCASPRQELPVAVFPAKQDQCTPHRRP